MRDRDKSCLFFAEDTSDGISPSFGLVLCSRVVVLGLGEGVSTASGLDPGSVRVGSTLLVEFVKALELSGLLDVLFVIGGLLLFFLSADLGVLAGGQAVRNVRVGRDLSQLGLIEIVLRRVIRESRCSLSDEGGEPTEPDGAGGSTYLTHLVASTIVILVTDGREKVHAKDLRHKKERRGRVRSSPDKRFVRHGGERSLVSDGLTLSNKASLS